MKPIFYSITFLFILTIFTPSTLFSQYKTKLIPNFSRDTSKALILSKKQIIDRYLTHGAYLYSQTVQEWQDELDSGLRLDSTLAELWRNKATGLFLQMKYSLGMEYVAKAIRFDSTMQSLEYRGFINCIFFKDYPSAIRDFEASKQKVGDEIFMDHTLNFYIGLSYLQLNQYQKAKDYIMSEVEKQSKINGETWVNSTDLFYLGIIELELKKYKKAQFEFEKALLIYPQFSDAQYYKSLIDYFLDNNIDAYKEKIKEAKKNAEEGYTIPEYNTVYERYPYQVNWKLRN